MSRRVAFAVLLGVCVAFSGIYVGWSAWKADDGPAAAAVAAPAVTDVSHGARILFQHVIRDRDYAKVVSVAASAPKQAPARSGVVCERVHYAAGHGLCLLPRRNVLVPSYEAILLDAKLVPGKELSLPGINNRARVSPDGRFAASTGFTSGDSYADRRFSTRTFIIDIARGKVVGNLEDFAVYRDGKRIRSVDFNFWGVTFARDSNRFYATLATSGKIYLVRGDVRARRMTVVGTDVECPSLSPDNTRIAFKRRTGGSWRLSVLDLRTGRRTPLAETRSVDDQAEWLDDETVLYGLEASVWAVPADGTGAPRKLIPGALSPAVIPRAA